VWVVDTHQLIGQPLTGHFGDVSWVTFSPDGALLASSGWSDHTLILWDVASGRPIGQPLTGHVGPAAGIAFSPDGSALASVSLDGTVRLWDVGPETWKARICQIAGRNLTREEWAEYLPGQPYQSTCPQWPEGE
jgi:WD40 repeat protein